MWICSEKPRLSVALIGKLLTKKIIGIQSGSTIPRFYNSLLSNTPSASYQLRSRMISINLLSSTSFYFLEAKTGDKILVEGEDGSTVLDVALKHNIDIEGACGGELACSTCHVILSQELLNNLPSKSEEEEDMLDLAWGLTKTYEYSEMFHDFCDEYLTPFSFRPSSQISIMLSNKGIWST